MMLKDFLINCDRFLWEEIYICGRQHYHGRQVAFSATSTLGNMTTEKRFVGIGDKNSSKVTFSLLVASAEALVVGLWYIIVCIIVYLQCTTTTDTNLLRFSLGPAAVWWYVSHSVSFL